MSVIDEVAEYLELMSYEFIRDEGIGVRFWEGLSWKGNGMWYHLRQYADNAELWVSDVSATQVKALIDYGPSGDKLEVCR